MIKTSVRFLSTPKLPRFAETLKEASKPALQHSHLISKPFGLAAPTLLNPQTSDKYDLSYTAVKHKMFSADAKEKRQKVLDHDIAHSPFYESKSFNNVNGKIFTPPVSYFKRDKSLYFPDFLADTLVNKEQRLGSLWEGKVSIVRVFSTVSGENCSKTYFDSDQGNYLTDGYQSFSTKYPSTQIIDVNMPQTALKKFIVNLSKGNLKKLIPEPRHNKYFIAPYKLFPLDVRKELNCDNVCSGYIYLLDAKGRIRWATSGSANEAEYSLMWKCVAGLEKELKTTLPKN